MCVNEGMAKLFLSLSGALALAAVFSVAQAAELGDAQVRSYIGQPLVADIELTAVADPGQAVGVRLASADVYRGANIAMHPVLSNLAMSVIRRDGRQFLHMTSVRPVASEYVHLFLELADGGKQNVRAATLWLAPDPNPAPPPPPVVVPAPAPRLVPAPVAARPELEAPPPAPKPALVLHLPPAGAACPQKFSDEQIKACSEAEYKNGLLSAQIIELEEKVKALQLAAEHKGEPVAKPAGKITPPLLPPKPALPPKAGFPWLLVSGIVLLLAVIVAGVFFVLSRRKSTSAETAAADSVAWYTRLAGRFKRTQKAILITDDELPAKPE